MTRPHVFASMCGTLTREVGGKVLTGYRCRYDVTAYDDALFGQFGVSFPPQLGNAVVKRRSEYLAGRLCAQHLLHLFGFTGASSEVPIGAAREPIWPAGVVASISHSTDTAVCLGTAEPNVIGVGIDIEHEMPADVAAAVKGQVVDSEEERIVRVYFGSHSQGLTIVFSAKEAIFKATHRLAGRFFDFSAMRVVRVGDDELVFLVSDDICDRLPAGATITVSYRVSDNEIETVTCLSAR